MANTELEDFVAAAHASAAELLSNARFIEQELPTLDLPAALRSAIAELCTDLVGTRFDVVSELGELAELAAGDEQDGVWSRVAPRPGPPRPSPGRGAARGRGRRPSPPPARRCAGRCWRRCATGRSPCPPRGAGTPPWWWRRRKPTSGR